MSPTGQIPPEQLASLLDQHARALEIYASQWCRSPEDCVQEAFVGLAARKPPPDCNVAWLYRAVRNRAINAARSAKRRTDHERQRSFEIASKVAAEFDPSQMATRRDEEQQLLSSLELLPADSRETVVLRIWSGLTWQQIAELTETSSSSAQRKYVQAIEQLRSILESTCLTKTKSQ
ncbi:RNA polymerase sigma factor [Mariniblastus fucicola]|uniref:RNA polymerase sigma factor RpoE n=1 Tax=Mariniblastus fucicola TaxID=980251 RepID=A0A5B9PHK8_9BACT|nr:sigma-70 family RNA polymerase sigma factor [Mariniblastus fucicola]QEG25099.1 RNA polymerase sigma factor RpoE [Mariniblastus fucicola]